MHFSFNLLRIKGLYMFRAILAHPQEARLQWMQFHCNRATANWLNKINEKCITMVSLHWYTITHGQQNIKLRIAICRTNRDIFRVMWNVSRYFKIFVYSTLSSGTPDCVQRNPGWETSDAGRWAFCCNIGSCSPISRNGRLTGTEVGILCGLFNDAARF
jgi:hypothetical protein